MNDCEGDFVPALTKELIRLFELAFKHETIQGGAIKWFVYTCPTGGPSWPNLLKWAEKVHSTTIPTFSVDGEDSIMDSIDATVHAILRTSVKLRRLSWNDVRETLKDMHLVAKAHDPRWA